MEKREVNIKLENLPLRSENISYDKIKNIFGGCKDDWSTCKKKSECCSGHCIPMSAVPVCA
jgi:hypothetical protein